MQMKIRWLPFLSLWLMTATVWAGGGPQNVLVVVNEASPHSLDLGNYYREIRGIPSRNLFRINVTTNYTINTTVFSNQVRNPILNYIDAAGLGSQIDYIVFSRDIPSRVQLGSGGTNMNALTSAMFYDYKFSPPAWPQPPHSCNLGVDTESDYFETEIAFTHSGWPSDGRYYITTMLTAWNDDDNRRLIDRSASADQTAPQANIFYMFTSSTARNVRWPQFDRSAFLSLFLDPSVTSHILRANTLSGQTNIMGYLTGLSSVNDLADNHYAPGALADHMTSFGGRLFDSAQMSILDWVSAGASGSYGTVTEPCAFTNKFPQARVHFWYARGFNLGESYYMSLRNPYQGVVIGDPLTAPYAVPPGIAVYGLEPGEVLEGLVNIAFTATASRVDRTVDRIDLFIDDLLVTTLTNIALRAGDEIFAEINGEKRAYEIQPGDTLADAAQGLAEAINASVAPPPLFTPVTAYAHSDRIELTQTALGEAGAHITYTAGTTSSPGPPVLFAHTPGTNLMETPFPARQMISATGTLQEDDVFRLVVTRLDHVVVSNTVTASSETSLSDMMTALRNQVNADSGLQGVTGVEVFNVRTVGNTVEAWVGSRTNTWEGYHVEIHFEAIGTEVTGAYEGKLTGNEDVIGARGMIFLSRGADEVSAGYTLDTAGLADGPHTLRAVAYEGSSLETQGHAVIPFIVSNVNGSCVIENPAPPAMFKAGTIVTAEVTATLSPGAITSVAFSANGWLVDVSESEPHEFIWDTSTSGAGVIELQAVAFGDGGERLNSEIVRIRVYTDTDDDGIPDWWEYVHFGSSTGAVADADADGDGTTNLAEYIADTDPTDADSFFHIFNPVRSGTELDAFSFVSSTGRLYQVLYRDAKLTEEGEWIAAGGEFQGGDTLTQWPTSNAPPATNDFRYYRVRVRVP